MNSTAAVRGDASSNSSLKSSSSPVSTGPNQEEPYTSPSGVVYTTTQRALRGIVVQLGQEGVLPSEAADMLLTMIREKDTKILSIYTKFQTGHDAGELIQSLMRLSLSQMEEQLESHKHALSQLNQQATNAAHMASMHARKMTEDHAQPARAANVRSAATQEANSYGQDEMLLNASDQKTVVEILSRAGAITPTQVKTLEVLINRGDLSILRVFKAYEDDKDVYKLIGALKGVEDKVEEEEDDEEEEEEEVEEEEEDDADDDDERFDESDRSNVEARFASIVNGMSLSNLETAALRLAIARDDSAIRMSLDMFRRDLNEQRLTNALHQIARDTIASTLEERGYQPQSRTSATATSLGPQDEEEEDDEEEEEDDEDEDDDDDDYTDEDGEPYIEMKNSGRNYLSSASYASKPRKEIASESDDDDEDDDEEDDEDDGIDYDYVSQARALHAGIIIVPSYPRILANHRCIQTRNTYCIYSLLQQHAFFNPKNFLFLVE